MTVSKLRNRIVLNCLVMLMALPDGIALAQTRSKPWFSRSHRAQDKVIGGRSTAGSAPLVGIDESSGSNAAGAGRLCLVDSQFTPPVTQIFEVDPSSAALALRGDIGVTYTPVLAMTAADDLTFYLAGTDTSGANACEGSRSCLLVKVILDPASTTPALVQQVGVMKEHGIVVPEVTGFTFRQDGQLYAISQTTYSLYRIDINTAEATLIGGAGLWQVGGRSKTSFHDWIRLDTDYVRERSTFLDFKILLKTFLVVLKGGGSY